jgi:hypothetical protein
LYHSRDNDLGLLYIELPSLNPPPKLATEVTSLTETAERLAQRIRGYWGVENKVHYVRDVTQGEDACRIRTIGLVQCWAIARNFALNLYRDHGFQNMAQAQRLAGFSCSILKDIFRMK